MGRQRDRGDGWGREEGKNIDGKVRKGLCWKAYGGKATSRLLEGGIAPGQPPPERERGGELWKRSHPKDNRLRNVAGGEICRKK